MRKLKQLISICATLALFSCAPQPVAAAQETPAICMQFSAIADAAYNAKKAGVPKRAVTQIIDEVICTDKLCEARRNLNHEIVTLAYSKNISLTELKAEYNFHCTQRFSIFY